MSEQRKKVTVIVEDGDSISTTTFFSTDNFVGQSTYHNMSIWEPKRDDPMRIVSPRPTTCTVEIKFIAHFDPEHNMIQESKVESK